MREAKTFLKKIIESLSGLPVSCVYLIKGQKNDGTYR